MNALPRRALAALVALIAAAMVIVGVNSSRAATNSPLLPPHNGGGVTLQWYWEISDTITPSQISNSTANIFDTDEYEDANASGSNGEPDGPSTLVADIHAHGAYSICYVEAGTYQTGFPDDALYNSADYGDKASKYAEKGWSGEWWLDIGGFTGWSPSDPSSFPGGSAADQTIAANIAGAMSQRIAGCRAEGQDAIEPDDLDAYTNDPGWSQDTAAASWGYEQWLAYTAHSDGLAVFQKNDPDNSAADGQQASVFDGAITEECNYYADPCSEWQPYLTAGKPVLNAEYTSDGETTSKFCPADQTLGITGALFDLNLDGKTYEPCQTGSGYVYPGGGSSSTTSTSTGTTTPTTSSSSTSTTVTVTRTSTSTTSSTPTTTTKPKPKPKRPKSHKSKSSANAKPAVAPKRHRRHRAKHHR
jgi:hypothetical protein